MKKLVISAAAFLISFSGYSQNKNLDYKLILKVTSRISFKYHGYDTSFKQGEPLRNNMIQPGLGFEWKSENLNSHEAYLNGAYNNYPNLTDAKANHQHYSVGYNYFINFNKNKNTKVVPSLGAGLNIYSEEFIATYSGSEGGGRSELDEIGTKAMLTPRMLFFPTSRMIVDISFPVCLANLSYGDSLEEYDGNIKSHQNDLSVHTFETIFNLQVGIGVKL